MIILFVVIPAKNEALTIGAVVTSVRQSVPCTVIVVDDGSSDSTVAKAEEAGGLVLPMVQSIGAWLATQAGLRYAARLGAQQVITMDADGQHRAEDIPALLEAQEENEVDVIIGACVSRGSLSRRIAWSLFKRLTGVNIADLTSGFRLYNKNALLVLTSRQASLLEFQDMGVLLMLRSAGLKMHEVTVSMCRRTNGISRVFSSWGKVTYYMMVTLFLCLVKALPERSTRYIRRLKQGS
ncbi:glycosyltransferase family 2 protein [Lacimicrobium sp. SS2-24]|uniref:glycosyltransferase family 2 protein n=1 Tax=Lacimicrobium sp. SS2-24 TaxID=2005569 RepID=UPI001FEFBDF3|nr:glycosyltransferase family 2 protein [Lacimicrobium sp. SS2-24]